MACVVETVCRSFCDVIICNPYHQIAFSEWLFGYDVYAEIACHFPKSVKQDVVDKRMRQIGSPMQEFMDREANSPAKTCAETSPSDPSQSTKS